MLSLTITPSSTSVTVEWGQVTPDQTRVIVGFSTDPSGIPGIGNATRDAPTMTYTKTGLAPSTTYYVKAIPFEQFGSEIPGATAWIPFTTTS